MVLTGVTRAPTSCFTALLAIWAAWLLSRTRTLWSAWLSGLRTSCYLWPGRLHTTGARGARPPPPPQRRVLIRRPVPELRPFSQLLVSPSAVTSPAASDRQHRSGDPVLWRAEGALQHSHSAVPIVRKMQHPAVARSAQSLKETLLHDFTPCTAVRTVRYKIYGYDPRDVVPGWQLRLDSMVRSEGACLAGAYVRPGCVELTLDMLVSPPPLPAAAAAAASTTASSGLAAQLLKAVRTEVSPPLRRVSGDCGRAMASPPPPEGLPTVTKIMGALGLDAEAAEAGGVQVQVLGLDPAAPDAPRVAQLGPRVLLVHQQQPTAPNSGCGLRQEYRVASGSGSARTAVRPDGVCGSVPSRQVPYEEWGSDDEAGERPNGDTRGLADAAASETTTVLLGGTVCRPMGHNGRGGPLSPPAVFARGNGEILPTRVVRFEPQSTNDPRVTTSTSHGTVAARAAAPVRGTCACCSLRTAVCTCECYELEVQLSVPRRAGVVLVELSWHNQPGQVMPLLALPSGQLDVASELLALATAAAAAEPLPTSPAVAEAASPLTTLLLQRRLQLLDSLLLDTGVWVQAHEQAALQEAHGVGCGAMPLPPQQRVALAANLMQFAARSGLQAMEAWLSKGLAELQEQDDLAASGEQRGGADGGLQGGGKVAAAATVAVAAAKADTAVGRVRGSCGAAKAGGDGPRDVRFGGAAEPQPAAPLGVTAAAVEPVEAVRVTRQPLEAPAAASMSSSSSMSPSSPSWCSMSETGEQAASGGCGAELADGGLRLRRCAQSRATDSGVRAQPSVRRGAGAEVHHAGKAGATTGAGGWAVWLHAFLVVMGFQAEDPAREAAYEAYIAPWLVNQERVIQVVEVGALMVLLFRARADPLNPAHLTTLFGALPGATTLLAGLLLPRPAWDRLATAVKVPRYMSYMAAKGVAVYLNRPLPPGLSSFQLGLAMVLHEGLLLPLACLLPIRVAAGLTWLKALPCAAMMLLSGVAAGRQEAARRCALVAAVALPTMLLCHMYLRVCFVRGQQRGSHPGDCPAAAAAAGALHGAVTRVVLPLPDGGLEGVLACRTGAGGGSTRQCTAL